MNRRSTWIAVCAVAAAIVVATIAVSHHRLDAQPAMDPELELPRQEARELKAHAKRLGMEVADLLATREKAEHERRLARAKQSPQMLVHEGSLFLLDAEWLFQFDVKTLEVKNVHNLELLRRDFMRDLEREERERRANEDKRAAKKGKATR